MASTRQCLLNQFADLSVCAHQNNLHKNSILVSDLRIYLFTFNLGGLSASSVEHLPSNPASVGRGEERDYIGDIRRRSEPPSGVCATLHNLPGTDLRRPNAVNASRAALVLRVTRS